MTNLAAWAAAGMGIALSVSVSAIAMGQPAATLPADSDTIQQQAEHRTSPVPVRTSEIERQPIRRDGAPASRSQAGDREKPPALPSGAGGLDAVRVTLAMGAVVGLIIVLRLLARWLFPSAASAARASTAVRVLARSPISPKQQVLLLQVGRRVIVVGDCGTQMNALSEIDDADEVAALLGQLDADRQSSGRAPSFRSLFGRARDEFVEPIDQKKIGEEPEEDASNGSGSEGDAAEQPPPDLGLAAARGELSGLLERVKGLSQQFRKS